ncbi:glycoside hydrolase family 113 [Maribacter sp. 4G9]|uniref:glycoside hydrolase family 113 n=1 Tax=Maribacter sp. 4G9 TaxID=1889777 RepID=UPI000C159607|nr:glycoside hydrolase TIM-barrel-like domain-containing protein [Maribacter sp. 4G9]PIB26263.1 glycoside hydrolase [Maribacter sp. 4G9]
MRNLGLLLLCFLQFCCTSKAQKKFNGVSFVASREEAAQPHVDEIIKIHANSAAVMPFGFIRDLTSPNIIFDTERQWFGETRKGAKQYIELLKKNGLQVMVKPQIWIGGGQFTGTINMKSPEDWKILEASYDKFILNYAELAEETKTPIFCIGTELETFVKNRPEYWNELIDKVRKVYSGKLTYAANWDEYARTPFWKQLDFIGIDAYFPLSESKTPSVEELKLGWQPWKQKISELALQTQRPVLFTEYGYRSMDFTAKKPWLVDRTEEGVNMDGQSNAKKAIFEEFWNEEWFAGGFVWKWFIQHDRSGGEKDNRFTPQNKPSQSIIANYYRLHKD